VFDIDDTLLNTYGRRPRPTPRSRTRPTPGTRRPSPGTCSSKPATPPSYLHCANALTCTTIEYKSGTRAHITSEGYSIMADFGDQYSDLLGGDAGHQAT
jgi:putative acid phosphatase of HAD superfamily subfamily IIIB